MRQRPGNLRDVPHVSPATPTNDVYLGKLSTDVGKLLPKFYGITVVQLIGIVQFRVAATGGISYNPL